jgi:hypothetical protein
MAFIAGAFAATFEGAPIGQIEDGFTIEYFSHRRMITGDNAGRAPQDGINLGLEVFVEFTLLEWPAIGNTCLDSLQWPFANADGVVTIGDHGVIGELDSESVEPLVLTAVAGTSAAGLTTDDVWTFPNTMLAEGYPVRITLSPDLRTLPLRLRVYPDTNGVYFTRG